MSICTPPLNTKPVPSCVGELTIGKVSYGNTNLNVFIKDVTTDAIVQYDATSAGDGTVTLDVTDIQFDGVSWSDKHSYYLWITRSGVSAKETIYIAGEDTKDVQLNFENVVSEGEAYAEPSVTLELA